MTVQTCDEIEDVVIRNIGFPQVTTHDMSDQYLVLAFMTGHYAFINGASRPIINSSVT